MLSGVHTFVEIHGGDFAWQPTVWFECVWQPTVLDCCDDALGPGVGLGHECGDNQLINWSMIQILKVCLLQSLPNM